MTSSEFEAKQWRVTELLQEALLRRLEDDGKEGAPRMVAAELAAALNFLKENPGKAPDESTSFDPFAQFDNKDEDES